jgi:UDP-glucose 4-epimerase
MLNSESIIIFGDGEQTRDFVHVDDVVQANIKAANSIGVSGAFNIASGTRITINDLVKMIAQNNSCGIEVIHTEERPGDVRHSLADISLANKMIGYQPTVELENGVKKYVEWVRSVI